MIKGYRDFIVRGNVIDLAVGVIMGAAFKTVVDSLIAGILSPLIAAIFGQPDLTHVGVFYLQGAKFSIGLVLTAIINFLMIAAAVYFFIVTPINKLRPKVEDDTTPPSDNELLAEIRDLLKNQQS